MDCAVPRLFEKSLKQMRSLRILTSSFSTTPFSPFMSRQALAPALRQISQEGQLASSAITETSGSSCSDAILRRKFFQRSHPVSGTRSVHRMYTTASGTAFVNAFANRPSLVRTYTSTTSPNSTGATSQSQQAGGSAQPHGASTWSYFASNSSGGDGQSAAVDAALDSYYSHDWSHISAVSGSSEHYTQYHEGDFGNVTGHATAFSKDFTNGRDALWYERSQAREAMKAASNSQEHRVLPTGGHWKSARVSETADIE